ncbi:MAG: hypothetical protein ACRENF_06305, partial [Thermodesulfobacteriota bacterium]
MNRFSIPDSQSTNRDNRTAAHTSALIIMQMLLKLIDSIKRYNLIEIELKGEIPEEEERFPFPFLPRKKKLTLWDFERLFRYASNNQNVLTVL